MFNVKGPGMKAESKNYSVNFPLEHAHKDMIFAQSLGSEQGVDMSVSAAATSKCPNVTTLSTFGQCMPLTQD